MEDPMSLQREKERQQKQRQSYYREGSPPPNASLFAAPPKKKRENQGSRIQRALGNWSEFQDIVTQSNCTNLVGVQPSTPLAKDSGVSLPFPKPNGTYKEAKAKMAAAQASHKNYDREHPHSGSTGHRTREPGPWSNVPPGRAPGYPSMKQEAQDRTAEGKLNKHGSRMDTSKHRNRHERHGSSDRSGEKHSSRYMDKSKEKQGDKHGEKYTSDKHGDKHGQILAKQERSESNKRSSSVGSDHGTRDLTKSSSRNSSHGGQESGSSHVPPKASSTPTKGEHAKSANHFTSPESKPPKSNPKISPKVPPNGMIRNGYKQGGEGKGGDLTSPKPPKPLKVSIPTKEEGTLEKKHGVPVMEEILREFALPPPHTAIQTPKKSDSSKFSFPSEKSGPAKTKISETAEKDQDAMKIKHKEMKLPGSPASPKGSCSVVDDLIISSDESDKSDTEEAGPTRKENPKHLERVKTISSSSESSSSASESSSESEGENESSSSDNEEEAKEKGSPPASPMHAPDGLKKWALSNFMEGSQGTDQNGNSSGPVKAEKTPDDLTNHSNDDILETLINGNGDTSSASHLDNFMKNELASQVLAPLSPPEQKPQPKPKPSKDKGQRKKDKESDRSTSPVKPAKGQSRSTPNGRRSSSKSPRRANSKKTSSSSQKVHNHSQNSQSPVPNSSPFKANGQKASPRLSDGHKLPGKGSQKESRTTPSNGQIKSIFSTDSESSSDEDEIVDVEGVSPPASEPARDAPLSKPTQVPEGLIEDNTTPKHRKYHKRKSSSSSKNDTPTSSKPAKPSKPDKWAKESRSLPKKLDKEIVAFADRTFKKSSHLEDIQSLSEKKINEMPVLTKKMVNESPSWRSRFTKDTPTLPEKGVQESPMVLDRNTEGALSLFEKLSDRTPRDQSPAKLPSVLLDSSPFPAEEKSDALVVKIDLQMLYHLPVKEKGHSSPPISIAHSSSSPSSSLPVEPSSKSDTTHTSPHVNAKSESHPCTESKPAQIEPPRVTVAVADSTVSGNLKAKPSSPPVPAPTVAPALPSPTIPVRSSPKEPDSESTTDTEAQKARERKNNRDSVLSQIIGTDKVSKIPKIPKRKATQEQSSDSKRKRTSASADPPQQHSQDSTANKEQEDSRDWHRKHPRRINERVGSSSGTSSRSSSRDNKRPRHDSGSHTSESDKRNVTKPSYLPVQRDWDAPYSPTEPPQYNNSGEQWSSRAPPNHVNHVALHSGPRKPYVPEMKLESSEFYQGEAKKLKHQADALKDQLNKNIRYIEAVLMYTLVGCAMERDPGINAGKSFTMYRDTLNLLKQTYKFRNNHDMASEVIEKEKKLTVLRLKIQSLLSLKLYKMKKAEAMKLKRALDEHNRMPSNAKSNAQAPSPYQTSTMNSRTTGTPSPMSPTPSPAGSVNSVGSVGSGGDLTSGKMVNGTTAAQLATPGSIMVPQRIHTITQNYLTITGYLVQSHDLWDQAQAQVQQIEDFFLGLDVECGFCLALHSSMRDLVHYVRCGIERLKDT